MDVVPWRDQDIEVAGLQRTLLDELESPAMLAVDLFVLSPPIEADEPPGEVVVDRGLRARRHDEREQRQRAVVGAVEEPLADSAAHAALRRRGLVLVREPSRVGEQLGKPRLDRRAGLLRRRGAGDRRLHLGNERPHDRRVEDELGDSSIVSVRGSGCVRWAEFTTRDDGALISGLRAGEGPPVLLLHGGPGMSFDYLCDLADELAEENDVAWYQQRGQPPSAVEGPHNVATDVDDARRVLDALGWDKAYVVGHSWGGHLALHVAEAMPDRLHGVLCVDPLGAVGDGRWPEFDEEMLRRTPESVRARAKEIDELSMKGAADDAL